MVRSSDSRSIQACLTTVSFPQELVDLEKMLYKNGGPEPGSTDLQTLLHHQPGTFQSWTAPSWMSAGDILFFYHAVSALPRVRRLRRIVEQSDTPGPRRQQLLRVLAQAITDAERYAGRVIGCTQIIDRPEYVRLPENERHFQSRLFAPFDRVDLFQQPLPPADLKAIVSISRQNALTPLDGQQFDDLRAHLIRDPGCPQYLRRAIIGGQSFRDVNASTWRSIACHPDARFIHENQLRRYLIDYLLHEISDRTMPVLEECTCERAGAPTGRADYMIRLGGRWVPVEAKLNIRAEPTITEQLRQYLQIDAFTPTVRARRSQRIPTDRHMVCLVVDQEGVYSYNAQSMRRSPLRPVLTRIEIGQLPAEAMRSKILAALEA